MYIIMEESTKIVNCMIHRGNSLRFMHSIVFWKILMGIVFFNNLTMICCTNI